ncbi:MAG: hypothetical protein IKO89_00160 [Bacteroidales bacterium]|nr:hypothetical protein [Bacteroidales bacterium]
MKRICLFFGAAMLLLLGCSQSKNVQYNADSDQVLGQHYTAKDFGLWYLMDFSDDRYWSLVDATLAHSPEVKQTDWDTRNGLLLSVSDTTDFMHALREGDMPLSPTGSKLIPCWWPISDSAGIVYQFNLCYGDASGKPIIDGTHVKKTSVEKNDYTGRYEVLMQFDKKTADFWQRFTAENVNSRIGIMLGTDRLLGTPRIVCEITGGACSISEPSKEDCFAIANILNGK